MYVKQAFAVVDNAEEYWHVQSTYIGRPVRNDIKLDSFMIRPLFVNSIK